MLVTAPGAMGKTKLLQAMEQRCPRHVTYRLIDLKDKCIGVDGILSQLCEYLNWDSFPRLAKCVRGWLNDGTNHDKSIGRAELRTALETPAEGGWKERCFSLTAAFFEDLGAMKGWLLFVFDAFDDSSAEVKEWIETSLLTHAYKTPLLIVIIAGRDVPKTTAEWRNVCKPLLLDKIHSAAAWRDYSVQISASLPAGTTMERVCVDCGGDPGMIAQYLSLCVPDVLRR